MAGLIYLADVDDLDSSISSKFGQVYAKYGDNVMATLGIDIVQVRYTTTSNYNYKYNTYVAHAFKVC